LKVHGNKTNRPKTRTRITNINKTKEAKEINARYGNRFDPNAFKKSNYGSWEKHPVDQVTCQWSNQHTRRDGDAQKSLGGKELGKKDGRLVSGAMLSCGLRKHLLGYGAMLEERVLAAV